MDAEQGTKYVELRIADAREMATAACLACGCNPETAQSLVDATISAACFGSWDMGFPHLLDFLDALVGGRINGAAAPVVSSPLPAFIHVDADGGIAQLGFDMAFNALANAAKTFGVAIFSQRNSFTTGEMGYYVRRLAVDGLVGLAFANGPALMTVPGATQKVYCTNPVSFGSPSSSEGRLVLVDQASSAAAFPSVRRAAERGGKIPIGWAIDRSGQPTDDAIEAVEGALVPFGGYKGGNIALIVELLAVGLSGASWSMDGSDFLSGSKSPDSGLTIIAISPAAGDPAYGARIQSHVARLETVGVRVPGAAAGSAPPANIRLAIDLIQKLRDVSKRTTV